MHANQASLSDSITNLNEFEWPLFYQSFFGPAAYSFHLNSHATTVAHRVDFLYKLLIEKVQKLVKGIATLSKGYLPPELFPPSFLREISERVALELHKDHHSYKLAFPHESTYYDMKLATFSLDKYFNLVVTFPIFIVPYHHQPLSLYEIETVPVPIVDQDPEASSFTELMIQKPYFAASDSSYIQLRNPELFCCKKVQEEYFCEETFMVKHTHHHTCESALFYNRSEELIASQCPFQFYHNRSVTPSVLDGGAHLVLANVKVGHSPTCDPQRLHNLPTSTYTLTSREILCNCTLQSDLAYLPSDLGACNATTSRIYFEERPNIAFGSICHDLLTNFTSPPSPPDQHLLSHAPDFPLNLTLPHNISSSIHTLRDLHSKFASNFSSFSAPGKGYVLTEDYENKLNEMRTLILEREEKFISLEPHVITIITWGIITANLIITGVLYKKYQMLKTLTATLTMLKCSSPTMAFSLNSPLTTESPSKAEVVCYDPIISGLLTFLSTMSMAIMMYQQWKNRNLCRGYLYNNTFQVKLVLGEDTHYLPLRIRKIVGHLHRVSINRIPPQTKLGL